MKKKVFAGIIVILVIVAAIVFFTRKDKPEEPTTTTVSQQEQQETTQDNTPEIQNGTKNPDKLIKITIPLAFYSDKKQGDTDGFVHKGNYEKIEINEKKKTFTVTMKSITHDFMLSNVGIQVIKSITSLLDNKDYPYIKQLGKYNSDFSEIELIVDEEKYEAAKNKDEIAPFVASCGVFYQMYSTENDYKCKVIIKGEKSGNVIDEYFAEYNNSNLG